VANSKNTAFETSSHMPHAFVIEDRGTFFLNKIDPQPRREQSVFEAAANLIANILRITVQSENFKAANSISKYLHNDLYKNLHTYQSQKVVNFDKTGAASQVSAFRCSPPYAPTVAPPPQLSFKPFPPSETPAGGATARTAWSPFSSCTSLSDRVVVFHQLVSICLIFARKVS